MSEAETEEKVDTPEGEETPKTEGAAGEVNEETTAEGESSSEQAAETEDVSVQSAEFQELQSDSVSPAELQRLNEIRIVVSAELGRKELKIQELLQLGPGAIVELDRAIESHVELVAQGVTLAKGEVVVVNEKFALKVTEVCDPSQLGSN